MEGLTIGRIHSTAIVSKSATLGAGVTIGAGTIVYDNVRIGEGVVIGPYCTIGEPIATYYRHDGYRNPDLVIGPRSLIRSHTVIYAGSTIGAHFECGHRATIRENTRIGSHCRVGTLCDIQGDCHLGDYVRLHSNVHVSQKSWIGNFVWIFPYTVLTNDPHPPSNLLQGVRIDDFAVLATMVVVLPGVHIGHDALVGAKALVREDVPPEAVVVGSPAKQICTIHEVRSRRTGEPVYPWREHFDRGMPWEGIGFEVWAKQSGFCTGR